MKRVSMACKKTECKMTPKPEHGEDRTGLENKNIQPQVKFTGSENRIKAHKTVVVQTLLGQQI